MRKKPNHIKVIAQSILLLSQVSLVQAAPNVEPNIPRPDAPANLPKPSPATTVLPGQAEQLLDTRNDVKLTVSSFEFTGNSEVSTEDLNELVVDYLNKEIGMSELNQVVRLVRSYYRDHGYLLAQAYLPAQDINKGVVKVSILEGKLGELKVEAADNLKQEFIKGMISRNLSSGDVIDERNLIKNAILVNALPGVNTTTNINPGAAVGTSDVSVNVAAEKPIAGYVALNTYGNRYTGREVAQAGVSFNNLNGIGDQLNAGVRYATGGGQKGANVGYITPINSVATLLNLNYNYIDYKLGEDFKSLNAYGDAHYASAYLDHTFIRDTRKGLALRIGGLFKAVDDNVGKFAINNRRNVADVEIGLHGDWVNARGTVLYQASASVTGGNVDIRDAAAKKNDTSTYNTDGSFYKWNLSGTRVQAFTPNTNWTLNAEYQGASKNLDNVEKFALGAINRWRAYSELPSQVDQGWMIGNELRTNWTVPDAAKFIQSLSPYAFIDYGRGELNKDPVVAANTVKSTHGGFGIDFAMMNKWNFGLTLSEQKRKVEAAAEQNETRFWGQLSKQF